MRNLIELRASDNQLRELPDSVSRLKCLRELYLRNNQLATLSGGVAHLSELRQLDLRGNPLTHLPEATARLPRLEKLDLRWVTKLRPTPLAVRPGGPRLCCLQVATFDQRSPAMPAGPRLAVRTVVRPSKGRPVAVSVLLLAAWDYFTTGSSMFDANCFDLWMCWVAF